MKTLKDIKQWFISGKYYMVDKEDLKQLAIEHIKHYTKERKKDIDDKFKQRALGSIRAISQMCNITKEDLDGFEVLDEKEKGEW